MANTKPQLLDHLGRPIVLAALREEVAAPTVAGVRSIVSGHPAVGLTPTRLAGILRAAEAGDATSYLELAEEMEEKDLHYLGVLGTRKRQVAQLDITVEAASDEKEDQENADLVRQWLDRDTLQDDLFDVLDAVGKGFSLTEIVWDLSERQWWPERLEFVLPQWTQFDRLTGKQLRLRDGSGEGAALQPFKFIQHQVRAKSGLPIRGGLARPVAWAWMFKNYSIKDWVAFAEVFGLPLRLGKYDPGATEKEKSTLLRAVTDISSDAAAIIPKSMEIDFVDGKQGATDGALFEKLANFFDSQTSRAVLGQDGTTAMAKGGGYAQSKTLDGVREDIEQADAKSLAATLRRDLVRPLIDLNRGVPKSGQYPKIAIGRAEAWDPEKMMPAVERFVKMGGRVETSVIRDRLGLPDPPKGREVELLQPPREAPAATPEKTAPEAANDPGRAKTPPEAKEAASVLLRRLIGAAASASAMQAAGADAIDRIAADELDGWTTLIAPVLEPLEQLVSGAASLEDLRDRLAGTIAGMDQAALAVLLARAGFNARLAGHAGVELSTATEIDR